MRKTVLFLVAVCWALPASAQAIKVDSVAPDSLHLVCSQCQLNAKQETLLVSDWDKKFWMKIDGKVLEFQSVKTAAEVEAQLRNQRWRETLKAEDITVQLDLVETGRGEDTAAFRGYIDVHRNGVKKHLLVAGGCGA
jgi:hypothetical protein